MPLPLPNLDDRTYAQLIEEARASIPALAPDWTDHNPSDPGITLIELFAFVIEALIYRTNQITDAEYRIFLQLINGSSWSGSTDLDADIRATVLGLRERYRAVTADDYEQLILLAWPDTPVAQRLGAAGRVARVRAFPRRNMERSRPEERIADAPGHISMVIVPNLPGEPRPTPAPDLIDGLRDWLGERRMLGTFHHVVPANYLQVAITATMIATADALVEQVRARVLDTLQHYFQPIATSADRHAWPFGRDVYISEIFQILDGVVGVDYVIDVMIDTPGVQRLLGTPEQPIGVALQPYELVHLLEPKLQIEKRSA